MTIRRIERPLTPAVGLRGGTRGVGGSGGFSALLDAASVEENAATAGVEAPVVDDHPRRRNQQEQLEYADELLESLEGFEQKLQHGDIAGARVQLQETRDHALSSLSRSAKGGEERELLHRTVVLATVELAKSDRGDYG